MFRRETREFQRLHAEWVKEMLAVLRTLPRGSRWLSELQCFESPCDENGELTEEGGFTRHLSEVETDLRAEPLTLETVFRRLGSDLSERRSDGA